MFIFGCVILSLAPFARNGSLKYVVKFGDLFAEIDFYWKG
jgi:hypothetical protein